MTKIIDCCNGCVYSQRKQQVWQIIAYHQEGCCVKTLAKETGLCIEYVETILEDLHVEETVYFHKKTGRWLLENPPVR